MVQSRYIFYNVFHLRRRKCTNSEMLTDACLLANILFYIKIRPIKIILYNIEMSNT